MHVTTHPAWLCRWIVFNFKIINNLFNIEFPIRIITITTTSAISSDLDLKALQISPPYRLYYNISPSYSSSIYSKGEWSESIVYGNSIRNRKKISTLKISAEACSLIFLLWGITYKKIPPYLLRNKRHAQPALHALWCHGKSVYYRRWELVLYLQLFNKAAKSAAWVGPKSPFAKKLRFQKLKIKTMRIQLFDNKGEMHKEFVPEGQTVTKEFYLGVLIICWSKLHVWDLRSGRITVSIGQCTDTYHNNCAAILSEK